MALASHEHEAHLQAELMLSITLKLLLSRASDPNQVCAHDIVVLGPCLCLFVAASCCLAVAMRSMRTAMTASGMLRRKAAVHL